jgi:hypothetical protein
LAGVELTGSEDRGILPAVAPFPVREGVDAEVEEERELISLPVEL